MERHKTLDIGVFKLLPPIEKEFETHYDLREYLESGGFPYRAATYVESKYLSDLNKITGGYIFKKYAIELPGDITVIIHSPFRGTTDIVVDDPSEIKNFMNGDSAYGIDHSGSEYEVAKDTCVDWQQENYLTFIVSDI